MRYAGRPNAPRKAEIARVRLMGCLSGWSATLLKFVASCYDQSTRATLAQLVERLIRNQQVAGSTPAGGSITHSKNWIYSCAPAQPVPPKSIGEPAAASVPRQKKKGPTGEPISPNCLIFRRRYAEFPDPEVDCAA